MPLLREMPPIPLHGNCRCILTPVYEKNPNKKKLRQTSNLETWLIEKNEQNPARVKELLGPAKYELWVNGVNANDFVSFRNRETKVRTVDDVIKKQVSKGVLDPSIRDNFKWSKNNKVYGFNQEALTIEQQTYAKEQWQEATQQNIDIKNVNSYYKKNKLSFDPEQRKRKYMDEERSRKLFDKLRIERKWTEDMPAPPVIGKYQIRSFNDYLKKEIGITTLGNETQEASAFEAPKKDTLPILKKKLMQLQKDELPDELLARENKINKDLQRYTDRRTKKYKEVKKKADKWWQDVQAYNKKIDKDKKELVSRINKIQNYERIKTSAPLGETVTAISNMDKGSKNLIRLNQHITFTDQPSKKKVLYIDTNTSFKEAGQAVKRDIGSKIISTMTQRKIGDYSIKVSKNAKKQFNDLLVTAGFKPTKKGITATTIKKMVAVNKKKPYSVKSVERFMRDLSERYNTLSAKQIRKLYPEDVIKSYENLMDTYNYSKFDGNNYVIMTKEERYKEIQQEAKNLKPKQLSDKARIRLKKRDVLIRKKNQEIRKRQKAIQQYYDTQMSLKRQQDRHDSLILSGDI